MPVLLDLSIAQRDRIGVNGGRAWSSSGYKRLEIGKNGRPDRDFSLWAVVGSAVPRGVMEFRVLGPFEVVDRDRPVSLGGPKQRSLLAVLLLHRGQVVSTDRLVEALWGERASPTAAKTVQVYVSNLRKALGNGLLVTRGHGYLLDAHHIEVDVDRFDDLVARGRTGLEDGRPREALAQLDAALALWRGPPLADLAYESFAQADIARLQDERLAATEDRLDARLALGDHSAVIGGLEALISEHPFRERLHAQLMLALYRSGRQADALEHYRHLRRELVAELGIEPGPALKELEQAILAQAPELRGPDPGATASGRRRRAGGSLVALGAALLLAVVITVAIVLSQSGSPSVEVAPNTVAVIDTRDNTVVGAIPVGTRPGAVAYGWGSLWIANQGDQTVSRLDPYSLRTLQTVPVGEPPTGIVTGAGGVWVGASNLYSANASVSRIDPEFDSLKRVASIGEVQGGPEGVAVQGDEVWAAPSTGLLTGIDAVTGRVTRWVDPNASPSGLATGDGAVWITDNEADNVTRVDPTGLLMPVPVGNGPSGIAVGEGAVWVADSLDNAVVRINPDGPAVTNTIAVGQSPSAVAVGAGAVWVANSGNGTVSRIDPSTNTVSATVRVGGSPQDLVVGGGRVWVTVDARLAAATDTSARATLRVDAPGGIDSLDPALGVTPQDQQLLQATCAKLLNLPDRPGTAAAQPTPELAESLPTPTDHGTTYTFTIRPGFRFSPPSDQPVTAQTIRYSLERAFAPKMNPPSIQDFTDIAGMSAYETGKAGHISGIVARGDTLTIHLLAPRPDLLARLTMQATCAVPTDTPVNPKGINVMPSAGPYYVQSFTPGQGAVLVRNPNYHGRRPHRFARIEVATGMSQGSAEAAVSAGRADYVQSAFEAPSANAGLGKSAAAAASQLARRYGPGSGAAKHGHQQYFINPGTQLDYFVLNTHRHLFSSLRVRQAVNYAIDRRALAHLGDFFQPLPERPTDNYLPPGVPGYRNTDVYPLTADPGKARQLASGHGRTAILYTCDVYPCAEQGQIVKHDLAAIGLNVVVKTLPSADLFTRLTKPGAPFDLAWVGWIPDFADPYGMLNAVLDNGSIVEPTFNDPDFQRKLAAAAQLSGPRRYLTYRKLDLDLVRNGAPLAAFGNLPNIDFFSARIGCQTYGPEFGMDLAALCLRQARR
jgi:YVTN family beta-propeller protein